MLGSLTSLAAGSTSSSGSSISFLPVLLLMVGVFYFLLIRPQQRRSRAQRSLLTELDVGDEVITIGGIHGTISEMDDDYVTVEVDHDVHIEFLRTAIARRMVYDDDDETADEAGDDDEADEAEEADDGGGGEEHGEDHADDGHKGPWFDPDRAGKQEEADEKK